MITMMVKMIKCNHHHHHHHQHHHQCNVAIIIIIITITIINIIINVMWPFSTLAPASRQIGGRDNFATIYIIIITCIIVIVIIIVTIIIVIIITIVVIMKSPDVPAVSLPLPPWSLVIHVACQTLS